MSRQSKRSRSIWPVVLILLLLAALSVGAGYLGGRYLLRGFGGYGTEEAPAEDEVEEDPAAEPEAGEEAADEPEDEDASEETESEDDPDEEPEAGEEAADEESDEDLSDYILRGSPLEFYRIQAGAFENEENARALIEQIVELDLTGVTVADGDVVRVVVDLTHDEQSAREIETLLTEAGLEALVTSWNLPGFEVALPVGEEAGARVNELTERIETLLEAHSGAPPDSGRSRAEEIRTSAEMVSRQLMVLDADLVPQAYRSLIIDHLESHLSLARDRPESSECRESFIRLAWAFRAARENLE
ncbi:MAG: SPOR domain-containing protein [Bacillota bacterium]